jgi:hypothetical protein
MYWYNRESLSLLLIPSAGNNGASFAAHRLKNTPGHAASP